MQTYSIIITSTNTNVNIRFVSVCDYIRIHIRSEVRNVLRFGLKTRTGKVSEWPRIYIARRWHFLFAGNSGYRRLRWSVLSVPAQWRIPFPASVISSCPPSLGKKFELWWEGWCRREVVLSAGFLRMNPCCKIQNWRSKVFRKNLFHVTR